MSNNTKIAATADILGGDVFFATDDGRDPEILENGDLLANGMYIRLNGSDGSVAYISAFELDKSIDLYKKERTGKLNQEGEYNYSQTLHRTVRLYLLYPTTLPCSLRFLSRRGWVE